MQYGRFTFFFVQATAKAQEDIKRILEVLNGVLESKTFLVGESVTLADISLATAFLQLYEQVGALPNFSFIRSDHSLSPSLIFFLFSVSCVLVQNLPATKDSDLRVRVVL